MSKEKSKGKALGQKEKEKIRERHKREIEQARAEQEREEARMQLDKLKETGIVGAYEQFLRSICKSGLPQASNVYEFAAQYVLKHEKKVREKQLKRVMLEEHSPPGSPKRSVERRGRSEF